MFTKGGDKSKAIPGSAPDRVVAGSSVPSKITADMKIVGNVSGAGDLEIDGRIEGDIESASLKIGETGHVKGNVAADSVRILGSFTGRVRANSVSVAASAKVNGELVQRTLSIEAGATIECHVRPWTEDQTKSGNRETTAKSGETTNVPKIAAASRSMGGDPGKASPG